MKSRIILITLALFAGLVSFAPSENGAAWYNDFTKAKTDAAEQNKDILMVFSGSDWCAPCIRLKKTLFSSEDFLKMAAEELVLLELDFPRKSKNTLLEDRQKHNKELAAKYNQRGLFPLVLVVDSEGNVKGQMTHPQANVDAYIADIKSIIAKN